MKAKIKNVLIFFLLLLISITIVGSIYYTIEYPKKDFDMIIFTLIEGVEYASAEVVNQVIFSCIVPVILLMIVLYLPIINNTKKNNDDNECPIEEYKTSLKFIKDHKRLYIIVLLILALAVFVKCFRVDDFILSKMQTTELFEKYYVNPQNVKIEFPEEKRNLIIIIAESIENTILSKQYGGAWEYSIMPELEKLAANNTNFSNNDEIGGPFQTHGTDYSAGGNVAITAGIPLKTVDILLDKNSYNGNGKYLDGAYTLRRNLKRK